MANHSTDPVLSHFAACLTTRRRADGNLGSAVALGDCTIMLQLIALKLKDFAAVIDPANPGPRFRGTTSLKNDMRNVLGDVGRLHIPKWGASHVRGEFRSDEGRGNKRDLIQLVELLNDYREPPATLREVYQQCIRIHHRFWDAFSIAVVLQPDASFQVRLLKLLDLKSNGRVQQGLVFSALRRRYGDGRNITTKPTFAADDQSSRTGRLQPGDVQVWTGERLAIAVEVKIAEVDETAWGRVAQTHGRHDYPLFLLAKGFRPKSLQRRISNQENTFALHLVDFLMSLIFTTALDEDRDVGEILKEVVEIYNREFCEQIEQNSSIKISFHTPSDPVADA